MERQNECAELDIWPATRKWIFRRCQVFPQMRTCFLYLYLYIYVCIEHPCCGSEFDMYAQSMTSPTNSSSNSKSSFETKTTTTDIKRQQKRNPHRAWRAAVCLAASCNQIHAEGNPRVSGLYEECNARGTGFISKNHLCRKVYLQIQSCGSKISRWNDCFFGLFENLEISMKTKSGAIQFPLPPPPSPGKKRLISLGS